MNKDIDQKEIEEYRHYLNLSIGVFQEELQRIERIENKASKYISALSIIFGFLLAFSKNFLDEFLPINSIFNLIFLFLYILIFILILFSWRNSFKVLKIKNYWKIPIDIKFFMESNQTEYYLKLIKKLKEKNEENRITTKEKTKFLNDGFKYLNIVTYLIGIYFVLNLILKIT